jgi:hypothetical protein
LKFEVALLTSCAEKSKADRGFRRSGAGILRAAPNRPISAQVCGEWARKSGCAALRMTVRNVCDWMSTERFKVLKTPSSHTLASDIPEVPGNFF